MTKFDLDKTPEEHRNRYFIDENSNLLHDVQKSASCDIKTDTNKIIWVTLKDYLTLIYMAQVLIRDGTSAPLSKTGERMAQSSLKELVETIRPKLQFCPNCFPRNFVIKENPPSNKKSKNDVESINLF